MTLGEKIKEARKAAGLTQEKLAVTLGVSRQAVTKWESDSGLPDIENLKNMARILNVSIDYLLEDGAELDLNVMREPINLDSYKEKGRWKKKARVIRDKFPEAKCHPLMAEKKRTKGQRIIDEALLWLTDLPETMDVVNVLDNMDRQFYLVEDGAEQYLVEITDEFLECRRLARKIEKTAKKGKSFGKFTIGEWTFRDCGVVNDQLAVQWE